MGIHLLNPFAFVLSPQGCPWHREPPKLHPCVPGSGWAVFPGEWGQPLPVPSVPWVRGQRPGFGGVGDVRCPGAELGWIFQPSQEVLKGKEAAAEPEIPCPKSWIPRAGKLHAPCQGSWVSWHIPGINSSPAASSHTPIVTGSHPEPPFPPSHGHPSWPSAPAVQSIKPNFCGVLPLRGVQDHAEGVDPGGKASSLLPKPPRRRIPGSAPP